MALRGEDARIIVEGETAEGLRRIGPVDRIIAATGQRPDLTLTRELRLDLDPWLESTKALGPLIDPNLHSCGSVPPHGHRELSHPEPGFYTVGIKSYGRAPTFLLLTGYEQVRSVAAAIAGDLAAADDVHLVLPETGVCTTRPVTVTGSAAGCCWRSCARESRCVLRRRRRCKGRRKAGLRMSASPRERLQRRSRSDSQNTAPRRHYLGARRHPNLCLGHELLSSGRARRTYRRPIPAGRWHGSWAACRSALLTAGWSRRLSAAP